MQYQLDIPIIEKPFNAKPDLLPIINALFLSVSSTLKSQVFSNNIFFVKLTSFTNLSIQKDQSHPEDCKFQEYNLCL